MENGDGSQCRVCGDVKPPDHFYRRGTGQDARCKVCHSLEMAARYATKRASLSDADLISLRAHDAKRKKAQRAAESVEQRTTRLGNARQRRKRATAENPSQERERAARRYRDDPVSHREHVRRWMRANPEKVLDQKNRRRARVAGTSVSVVDLRELWTGSCGLCQELMDKGARHPHPLSPSIDHIVPLAVGGAHSADNLQWAHLSCNQRKGASLLVT